VTIFHAASNTFGSFDLAEAAVALLLAAIVVIVFGPAHLSRRGERIAQDDKRRPTGGVGEVPVAPGSPASN
jgi:hypothetical protein